MPVEPLTDFLNRPDPVWLFERLLPVGDIGFIYGPPESLKSFAVLTIGGCLTTATAFANHAALLKPAPVLYMAAEGIYGARLRIKALIAERRFDPLLGLVDTSGVQFHEAPHRRNLIAQLKDLPEPPRLLIVDTFARHAIGLDENSSRDTSQWVGGFETVCHAIGASGLVNHHSGKDIDRGMRGSSALLGAAGTVIRVERDGDSVLLSCDKQRDAEPFATICLTLRPCHGSAILDHDQSGLNLTEDQLLIIATASANDQSRLVRGVVLRANDQPMPNGSFNRAMSELIRKGLFRKVSRGVYEKK